MQPAGLLVVGLVLLTSTPHVLASPLTGSACVEDVRTTVFFSFACAGIFRAKGVSAMLGACILLDSGNVDCHWAGWCCSEHADYEGLDAVAMDHGVGHTCVLRRDSTVHCLGSNAAGESDMSGMPPARSVSVSSHGMFTCIVTLAKDVACRGSDADARQLHRANHDVEAVSAGVFHTCALLTDRTVVCRGSNEFGQASGDATGDAVALDAGAFHTCALTSAGTVRCSGYNDDGRARGYDGGDAIAVSTGTYHTCVLLSAGNVDCFGNNQYGQAEDHPGPAVAVSAGGDRTCILTPMGTVDCYGRQGDFTAGYLGVAPFPDLPET